MPSKRKTSATKKEAKPALMPKLRFPEFRNDPAWKRRPLSNLCERIVERVGDTKLTTVSITAGYGYVSQAEKFGRDISGAQYKNYIHLRRGNFAYNKGNSNLYPQGCVYQLKEFDEAAASNAFICFNLLPENAPGFFEGLFEKNAHGEQLKKFLTSGARSDGLLNIKPDEFFSVEFPIPHRLAEQQKIAECLSSVDEVIAAQARKVDALKTHKKGLMQQLFPREGETQPRLRFPEFQNAGAWSEEKLDDLVHFQDGFAFKSTDFVKSQEDATQVIRITDINNKNTNEDKVFIPTAFLERNKLGKYRVDDGDLLLSLTGAAGFNFFFWNGGPAAINQRTAKLTAKMKSGDALLLLLEPLIHEKINERGEGQNNNLSKEFLSTIVLLVPEPDEQHRIATCLSSLDALIAAETQKHAALQRHKRGLMQQLFPSPGES